MISRTEKNKSEREKIKREEKKEKTKKFLLKFIKYFTIISIILISTVMYIYYVSTRQLIIREYVVTNSNIPYSFDGIKIIQFGDLYFDDNYLDILDEITIKINKFKPDIILFTGGLIHKNYVLSEKTTEIILNKLSSMNVRIGKYFTLADGDDEKSVEILTKANFKFLDDQSELIYYESESPILLSGINKNSKIDYSKNKNYFNLVMVNDSRKIDEIIELNNPNVILSGKNLNGQLRIPYYGALINHNEYTNQHYNLNNVDIYITGGIGTNNIPVRIFNHPSINLYRLKSK